MQTVSTRVRHALRIEAMRMGVNGIGLVPKVRARAEVDDRADAARGTSRLVVQFVATWALGVGFLWWIFAAVRLSGKFAVPGKRRPLARRSLILILIGLMLLGSLVANLLAGTLSLDRVPGALYAVMFWISAFVVYEALNRGGDAIHQATMIGLMWIATIQGGITALSVALHPSPISSLQFLTARIPGVANSGVAPWTGANLAYVDFFGGAVTRSAGLMGTAAWTGGFACLMLLALVGYRRSITSRRFLWWSALIGSMISLYASYSRVSTAILAIGVVVMLTARALTKVLGKYASGFWIPTAVTVLLVLAATVPFRQIIVAQDALRPGSSQTRFVSYISGTDAVFDHGFFTALLGNGAKPFLADIGRGVGSESTYVSLLVRGGIVTLFLLCAFLSLEFISRLRSGDITGGVVIAALAIHAAVEDLDVGTLTLLVALVSLAPRSDQLRLSAAAAADRTRRASGRRSGQRR